MIIGSALDNPGYLDVIERKGRHIRGTTTSATAARPSTIPVEIEGDDLLGSLAKVLPHPHRLPAHDGQPREAAEEHRRHLQRVWC